jgi:acetyl-CoA acetyltransferase family protein
MKEIKPAFRSNGTVTAGNSSPLNDGASAVLMMSRDKAKELGLEPLATVRWMAVAGVDPTEMGLGPIPATRKCLARSGLKIEDIDLIELNEAFASQSIYCIRELGMDMNKVNVNGGAIALGHPLGSSGCRIIVTLAHEMKRRNARYGLATLCVGFGQGATTIIEREKD